MPATPPDWRVGGVRLDAEHLFTVSYWTGRGELGRLGGRAPHIVVDGLTGPRGVSRTDDGLAVVARPDHGCLSTVDTAGVIRGHVDLHDVSPWSAVQWGDQWLIADSARRAVLLAGLDGRHVRRLPVPFELRSPRSAVPINDTEYLLCDRESQMVVALSISGDITWQYGKAGFPSAEDGCLTSPEHAVPVAGGAVIADTRNHRVLRVDQSGRIVWTVGGPGMVGSAPGRLWHPISLSHWRSRVVVTDAGNDRLVELTEDGHTVGTYGGGVVHSGELHLPRSLEAHEGGFSVADSYNNRVVTFSATGSGCEPVDTVLGKRLFWPRHTTRIDGVRVISDSRNGRVLVSPPGTGWSDLRLTVRGWPIQLVDPHAVRGTPAGAWLFADTGLNAVLLVDPATSEVLHIWRGPGPAEELSHGDTTVLPLLDVHDAAIDDEGGLWLADTGHDELLHLPRGPHRPRLRGGGVADGRGSPFRAPRTVTVRGGEVLVTDSGNHRVMTLDRTGTITGCFGRRRGYAMDCLSDPRFSGYSNGSVAIADYLNDRVLLVPRSVLRLSAGAHDVKPGGR